MSSCRRWERAQSRWLLGLGRQAAHQSASQRLRSLTGRGRTHADHHQAVIGHSDRPGRWPRPCSPRGRIRPTPPSSRGPTLRRRVTRSESWRGNGVADDARRGSPSSPARARGAWRASGPPPTTRRPKPHALSTSALSCRPASPSNRRTAAEHVTPKKTAAGGGSGSRTTSLRAPHLPPIALGADLA